ncbi:hypothetical protein [Nocardiopsis sp. CC223A]|uniref:hypothetical protein n=1 Tax=Nocardiopsis sp. CC223A TaxID=3044051 RepID=UPI00278BD1CB|nr:hypothetical protein [Nocardiopsis sp. CC223A]
MALQDGVVSHGRDSENSEVRVWFQSWESGTEPSVIDVSSAGLKDDETDVSLLAIHRSVVVDSSENSDKGSLIFLGLT